MDLFEALEKRQTIHDYQESDIDPAILERALQFALRAPNHKLTFPWHFVVVGKQTRLLIKDLAKRLQLKKRPTPPTPEEEMRIDALLHQKFVYPAALIAFCCKRSPDPFRQREDYAAVSCAIQNFCLAMTAHHLGSKWSSGEITFHPETYNILQIDPETFEIIGFVWAGIPERIPPPQKRPPLADALTLLP
jgi:nitroreductase